MSFVPAAALNSDVYEMSAGDYASGICRSDGIGPDCDYLNRMIAENIFRLDPEINQELERLRQYHWADFHQRKLRMLVRSVFMRDYLPAYNVLMAYWRMKVTDGFQAYRMRWGSGGTELDAPPYTQAELTELLDGKFSDLTTDSEEWQELLTCFREHVDFIAEWCCAEYSHWPEIWTGLTKDLQAVDLWAGDTAAELERIGAEYALLSKDLLSKEETDSSVGRPRRMAIGKILSPEDQAKKEEQEHLAIIERERIKREELRRELELNKLEAITKRKLQYLEDNGYTTGHTTELMSDYETNDYVESEYAEQDENTEDADDAELDGEWPDKKNDGVDFVNMFAMELKGELDSDELDCEAGSSLEEN